MDSIYNDQAIWNLFPIDTLPNIAVESTVTTSEFQELCEWLESISYASDPATTCVQPMATISHHSEQDVFLSPLFSNSDSQSPTTHFEEYSESSCADSTHSISTASSPIATYSHSIYIQNAQHKYLLDNNFLEPHQAKQCALLQQCLASPWLNANEREPNDMPRHSVLLGFLAQNISTAAFKCQFDGCDKDFERQDRALGHIRMHLSHRPYVCSAQCGNPACVERFCCRSYLQSHLTRQKEGCKKCGKALFRQNMRRHAASCTGSSTST